MATNEPRKLLFEQALRELEIKREKVNEEMQEVRLLLRTRITGKHAGRRKRRVCGARVVARRLR
jgi:hypothetical protein